MFEYSRVVNVYETDLMGIVHHSNYLRFCEEARVDWCRAAERRHGLNISVMSLAVYETKVWYTKPLKYNERFKILLQLKVEGVRIIFQYKIYSGDELKCRAETVHCTLDEQMRVKRMSKQLTEIVEKEVWIETWL